MSDRSVRVLDSPLGHDGGRGQGESELWSAPADLFRSLFESSGLCVAAIDLNQRVRQASDEFARLIDRDGEQLRGLELYQVLHPCFAVNLRGRLARLAEGRYPRFTENVMVLRRDGRTVSGDLTGVAVRAHGRPALVIVLFTPYRAVHEPPQGEDREVTLTDAGARVLEGVAAGASTNWLAAHLYLSRQGVDYHVRSLLRKLDAPNRPALVSRAYALGILRPGEWPPRVASDRIR